MCFLSICVTVAHLAAFAIANVYRRALCLVGFISVALLRKQIVDVEMDCETCVLVEVLSVKHINRILFDRLELHIIINDFSHTILTCTRLKNVISR